MALNSLGNTFALAYPSPSIAAELLWKGLVTPALDAYPTTADKRLQERYDQNDRGEPYSASAPSAHSPAQTTRAANQATTPNSQPSTTMATPSTKHFTPADGASGHPQL